MRISRRAAYSVAAALGWLGTGLRLGRNLVAPVTTTGPTGGLFGPYRPGFTGGMEHCVDDLSYFTHWSNLAIALVWTLLALNPDRDSERFRWARNTALIMITLTGVLYAALIAPTDHVVGWFNLLVNTIIHYLNPALALAVWSLYGPHGWFSWRTAWRVYLVPVAYLAFTLVRGAFIHRYPYVFFNVVQLGYLHVLITMAVIVVASTLVVALFVEGERLLLRRR